MLANGIFKGNVQKEFQGSASFVEILIYCNQNWFGPRPLPQAVLALTK